MNIAKPRLGLEIVGGAVSTVLSIFTAAWNLVHKVTNLLPLHRSEQDRGTMFSVVLIVIALPIIALIVRNKTGRVRTLTLGGIAVGGLLGVVVVDIFLRRVDSYWKNASLDVAGFVLETIPPFLFGLGHAFLSVSLLAVMIIVSGLFFREHSGRPGSNN